MPSDDQGRWRMRLNKVGEEAGAAAAEKEEKGRETSLRGEYDPREESEESQTEGGGVIVRRSCSINSAHFASRYT